RTGSARVDIYDVVVRSAALARVDADRRLAAPDGSRADARRRLAVAAIPVGEGVADVVNDRVLHSDHKMLALASAQASDVGGEDLLERAAGAETLDLAVDDRRIDRLDRLVTEAEALYRTGSEVLDHHVGAFDEALDELESARVLQVYCGRTLVRVVLQKIDR